MISFSFDTHLTELRDVICVPRSRTVEVSWSWLAGHPVSSHSDTANVPGVGEWNSGGDEFRL